MHLESGKYSVGDNYHQLRYLTRIVNNASRKTFDLITISSFSGGSTATHIFLYCMRQYNKDKKEKNPIELFLLADRTHYFVRHIDFIREIIREK